MKGSVKGINALEWFQKPTESGLEGSNPTDHNTICMSLSVLCRKVEDVNKEEINSRKKFEHGHVYAKDLKFEPVGRQDSIFVDEDVIRPVNPDILIAKLRPGQEIEASLHCIKGIGADHAKFSPVATATYRLLPKIDILRPIIGTDAIKFQKCFPEGVIALEKITAEESVQSGTETEGKEGQEKAVVRDAFGDTVSRECLRHEEFQGKVKLGRVQDHFIFSVESTGQFNSDLIFLESVKILRIKARQLQRSLKDYTGNSS